MRVGLALVACGLALFSTQANANDCEAGKPLPVPQICGEVHDPSGELVHDIELQLQRKHQVVAETGVDANGQFSFGAVPEGRYDLTTKSAGWYLLAPIKLIRSKATASCKHPLYVKLGVMMCTGGVGRKPW
jgi:hypothetical protein